MIEYIHLEPSIDFIEGDISKIVTVLATKPAIEQEPIVNEIKSQMVGILKHFIGCTWGAHYMTQYYKLIHPYLDNPDVLDFVLKSDVILDRKNVLSGVTGAKVFPLLADMLKGVESQKIKQYMADEFPNYQPPKS
jgi:hypothetical protein